MWVCVFFIFSRKSSCCPNYSKSLMKYCHLSPEHFSTVINILICKHQIPGLLKWYNFACWSLILSEQLFYFEHEVLVRKLHISHSSRHHKDLRGGVSFVNIHCFMYTLFCPMPCHKRKIHAVLLPKEEIFFPYLSRPVKVTPGMF